MSSRAAQEAQRECPGQSVHQRGQPRHRRRERGHRSGLSGVAAVCVSRCGRSDQRRRQRCRDGELDPVHPWFLVRLQEGAAGRAQVEAADRAEYYRRNRQAAVDPVVVRHRLHSRSKTEGRLYSESSIGANMSRRNICRRRKHPICQNQIGHLDKNPLSCPAGAGPADRAGLRWQLQD